MRRDCVRTACYYHASCSPYVTFLHQALLTFYYGFLSPNRHQAQLFPRPLAASNRCRAAVCGRARPLWSRASPSPGRRLRSSPELQHHLVGGLGQDFREERDVGAEDRCRGGRTKTSTIAGMHSVRAARFRVHGVGAEIRAVRARRREAVTSTGLALPCYGPKT
jgi:hypothetical protein